MGIEACEDLWIALTPKYSRFLSRLGFESRFRPFCKMFLWYPIREGAIREESVEWDAII